MSSLIKLQQDILRNFIHDIFIHSVAYVIVDDSIIHSVAYVVLHDFCDECTKMSCTICMGCPPNVFKDFTWSATIH